MGLIVDNFAGGGGASEAIFQALGRHPDIAINHDDMALNVHAANHAATDHLVNDVWGVDPVRVCKGQPVDLAWFSPDCKHFSKAKGATPTQANIRDLAWVVVKWARAVRPRIIVLENVQEFEGWGPLGSDGKPEPSMKGETFRAWLNALRAEGYAVQWRLLRACDYGAPTIRERLFLIARCDGQPIVWPAPTHAPRDSLSVQAGRLPRYRAAADIIDWSLPVPSIFDTKKQIWDKYGLRAIRPLAANTERRIADGIDRFVLNCADPFFITYAQHGGAVRSGFQPLHTITASPKDQNAIVVPELNAADARTARKVAAFMAQHNTGVVGHDARSPVSTITGRGTQQQLVAVHLQDMHGTKRRSVDLRDPHPTVCAGGNHSAAVFAFMQKYYGTGTGSSLHDPMHTLTTKDRQGLVVVTVKDFGQFVVTDIGMRMLSPREQFAAQGFPADYVIDRGADGQPIKKTDQTHLCGNSVSPPPAVALLRANCDHLIDAEQAVRA